MKNKNFIYEYWSRTELGRQMIASDAVSDNDLLFLIPNNVKRRHGLPVTRTYGKRKSVIKRHRKRFLASFQLFDIISELVEELIPKAWNGEFFNQFVDFKDVSFGDKEQFEFEVNKFENVRSRTENDSICRKIQYHL